MTETKTGRGIPQNALSPMDRVLMLIALGLDPRFKYTNHELQSAWRRRINQVHPDHGGNEVLAAAVNASVCHLGPPRRRLEAPRPGDVTAGEAVAAPTVADRHRVGH